MNQDIIHVYFMPGMAASSKIFEYIELPETQFQIHYLEWLIPSDNELLSDYARRMSEIIEHKKCVLLGVSFGGVLVQEMSKYLNVQKLIIVSSIKSRNELPKKMILAKVTKAYKLLPVQLVSNIDLFSKFLNSVISFSKASKEPKSLLIASAKPPEGCPPPFGDITFQNNEWL